MIFRENSGKNYTNISNTLLHDSRLSFKARGIAVYLLSKHEDWETSIADLKNNSPKEGRDSVRSGLQELEAAGFATRNRIKEVETNKYLGERWFVSDNKDWIKTVVKLPYALVVRENGRYRLAKYVDDISVPLSDLPDAGKAGAGKAGGREIQHNKVKTKESKEKKKVKKEYPAWSIKAATWWYNKLEEAGLLSNAILRKNKIDIIQSWAIVLDKINRLDGYDPTEIGKVLEWLFTTRNYVNGRGQADKGGFWFGLNNFGSLSSFRRSKGDTEETKFDWMYAGWDKDQKRPKKNQDNFQRG